MTKRTTPPAQASNTKAPPTLKMVEKAVRSQSGVDSGVGVGVGGGTGVGTGVDSGVGVDVGTTVGGLPAMVGSGVSVGGMVTVGRGEAGGICVAVGVDAGHIMAASCPLAISPTTTATITSNTPTSRATKLTTAAGDICRIGY